jgi:hypothetical protein
MNTYKHVRTLWHRLSHWFVNNWYLQVEHLDKTDIILVINDEYVVFNQIIINKTFVILRGKINNKLLTFAMVKACTKYTINIEKHVPLINHKADTYLGKWSAFMSSLN